MPITMHWDTQQADLIRYHMSGKWTWDDMIGGLQEVKRMIETELQHIDIIIHCESGNYLPLNFLGRVKELGRLQMHNPGMTIMITTSPFLHSTMRATRFVKMRRPMMIVETEAEALKVLEEQRLKLKHNS